MNHDKRVLIGRFLYLAAQAMVVVADYIQPQPKELGK